MSQVLITNYRGYDINFDTNSEKFSCVLVDKPAAYSGIKKAIDEYLKENDAFEPFPVESRNGSRNESYAIVGKTKDGRWMVKNPSGSTGYIGKYNEGTLIITLPENIPVVDKIIAKRNEWDAAEQAFEKELKDLRAQLKIIPLAGYEPPRINKKGDTK